MNLTFGFYGAYGLAVVLAGTIALSDTSGGVDVVSLWVYAVGLLLASLLSVAGAVLVRAHGLAPASRAWGWGAAAYGLALLVAVALGGAYEGIGLLAVKLVGAILNPILAAPEGGGPDARPLVLLLCFIATAPVLMTLMQLHQGIWVLRRRGLE